MDTQRDVKKMGYLKKHNTMKKKLFVLREESLNGPARLEYYDNEKKFVCNNPKRSIHLHNCFSINPKSDAKHKHVIMLFTKEECFSVICENETDQKAWLSAMVELRNSNYCDAPKNPMYEHIWSVNVKSKGLGSERHLTPGHYRLCLTHNELSFIRKNNDSPDLVFQLASIRKCGHTDSFFYLELGRMSVTGSGILWIQVDDIVIAQNMHETILSFMTASHSSEEPVIRIRRHTISDRVKPPKRTSTSTIPITTPCNTSSQPVTRSISISAADSLARRRGHAPHSCRPLTSIEQCLSEYSHEPPSPTDGHRTRTDSMDSAASHNTGSISADEIDGSSDVGWSTPKTDSFMSVNHPLKSSGLSPVASSTSLTRSDQWDSHEKGTSDYLEMNMSQKRSREMSVRLAANEFDVFGDERTDGRRSVEPRSMSWSSSQGQGEMSAYISMNPGTPSFEEKSYMDMSQNSSVAASPALSSASSLHDVIPDSTFFSMTGSTSSSMTGEDDYFIVNKDMSHSPSPRPSQELRPDRVCSYLADDTSSQPPFRSSSVGSRPQLGAGKPLSESYMEMDTKHNCTNSGQRTSSAPVLSRNLQARAHAIRMASQVATPNTKLSKETLEEKDFLMEMDFNSRRHGREHDYEEIRPRSSSGGTHDFRPSPHMGVSQERRRTGSFGYREKLSKLASMARASVQEYRNSEPGHRQRIATIGQDLFHKRTSSFGNATSDMRPRSSSHGNARYVDMSKLRKSLSNNASEESLPRMGKRGSHDSGNDNEYLEMRRQVPPAPSHALASMFKGMARSPCSSTHSPVATDSDYLSMELGKSSGDSSVELPGMHRSPRSKSPRGKVQVRKSSITSRPSHSSSESLTSNTSHSSEGRSSRGVSATISEASNILDSSGTAEMKRARARAKAQEMDDSYVIYSPASRDHSPHQQVGSLDKVSSPITENASQKKHEYVNVDYQNQTTFKPSATVAHVQASPSVTSSPVRKSSLNHTSNSAFCRPTIPCPPPPNIPSTGAKPKTARSGNASFESAESDYFDVSLSLAKAGASEPLRNPSQPAFSPPPIPTDYMLVSPQKELPATLDYMEIKPSKQTPNKRPQLPSMPIPAPKLQMVVSPIRDTREGAAPIQVTPLPVEDDDYLEIRPPLLSLITATSAGHSPALTPIRESMSACTLASDSTPLSTSKTSLNAGDSPEINYATLDLHEPGDKASGDGTLRPKHTSGSSSSSNEGLDVTPLQYAQIDFQKSEQTRKSTENKKTPAPFDL